MFLLMKLSVARTGAQRASHLGQLHKHCCARRRTLHRTSTKHTPAMSRHDVVFVKLVSGKHSQILELCYLIWVARPHRLAARTWPSQGQNTGSIPVGAIPKQSSQGKSRPIY